MRSAVNRAGWTVDAFHFAESGGVLEGRLESAELPRLAELAVSPLQPFEAHVAGLRSPRGKSGLELRLRGAHHGKLPAVAFAAAGVEPWSRMRSFELERSEAQADAAGLDEDEVWDAVVGSERFDLIQLCEDELLLAVPYAPMHEVCEPAGASAAGDRVSPFAALAQLKRS